MADVLFSRVITIDGASILLRATAGSERRSPPESRGLATGGVEAYEAAVAYYTGTSSTRADKPAKSLGFRV